MIQSNILFIGMDVHKESIVISLADDDRTEVRRYGAIGGTLTDFKNCYVNWFQKVRIYFFVMKPVPVAMSCIALLFHKAINALSPHRLLFLKNRVIKLKPINAMPINSPTYYVRAN